MIWPRSAILHRAAASIVDGTFAVTVSIALRIATRTSAQTHRVRQVDRVLDDVDFLVEVWRYVDRGVRYYQRIRMARHVHDEAVADPAGGANPGLSRDHGAHQFVRVETALHESFNLARRHQLDCLRGRVLTVLRGDNLHRADIKSCLRSHAAQAFDRTHEHRFDQPETFRLNRPA